MFDCSPILFLERENLSGQTIVDFASFIDHSSMAKGHRFLTKAETK